MGWVKSKGSKWVYAVNFLLMSPFILRVIPINMLVKVRKNTGWKGPRRSLIPSSFIRTIAVGANYYAKIPRFVYRRSPWDE